MKLFLYTIHDRVAEECGPVFQAPREAVAVRQYRNLIAKEGVLDASDFDLLCLGTMDTGKVLIEAYPTPVKIDTHLPITTGQLKFDEIEANR